MRLFVSLLLLVVLSTSLVSAHPLGQDSEPPVLVNTTPTDQSTGVPTTTTITFVFNEAIFYYQNGITLECPTGTAITFAVAGDSTDTLTLTPNAPLPAGVTCSWTIIDLSDTNDNFIETPLTGQFSTSDDVTPQPTTTVTILAESFESGALPTSWSLEPNSAPITWSFNNPGGRENNTGGRNQFAILDSDKAGNGAVDASMVTPGLNLAGYTKITLRFNSDFRYYDGGAAEKIAVDIETAPQTWQTLWSRTAEERGPKTVDVDLTPHAGGTHRLRFRYYDADYDWWWQVDEVQVLGEGGTQQTAPAVPSGIGATADSATQITVNWTDNSNDETAFELQRSTTGAGDSWITINQPAADSTSYADSGLTCNSEYHYRVRAVKNGLFSAYTDAARATTGTCSTGTAGGGDAGQLQILVAQVLGQQSGRYVAGKDTGVIVFTENAIPVNRESQQVVVKRGGQPVVTLRPQPADGNVNTLVFLCSTFQSCGEWQAGTYAFEATINGATTTQTDVAFQERRPIRVLSVPVRVKYGTEVKSVQTDEWKRAGDFLRTTYPVSRKNFQWEIGPELDVSTANILTNQGQYQVWLALKNLQQRECRASNDGSRCFDRIVGYLAERPGTLNGYTYGAPANVVAIQPGMFRTTAHEIGHTYRLGDEYNGGQFNCDVNPTPTTYRGRDYNRQKAAPFSCTNPAIQPFSGRTGGTSTRIIIDEARPFRVRDGTLLTGDLGNFMGNFPTLDQAWISPHAWKQIFDQLAPPVAIGLSAAARTAKPQRVVLAEGTITPDGEVSLQPWYTFESTNDIASADSPHRIDAIDGSDQVLASRSFELIYDLPDQEGPLPQAPFAVEVPFPDGVVAFQIISGTQVLETVSVSTGEPTVSITSPSGGETLEDEFTITWEASDPDGDTLYFDVAYNETGNPEDWFYLATAITETTWTDDFSTLPGSNAARIQVVATDGVNIAEATSESFAVPLEAPEVFIFDPFDGDIFVEGDFIFLDGDAYDPQEDWIVDDNAWIWSSSIDGEIGRGPFVIAETLSVGEHIITLEVTNSAGLSGEDFIEITVEGESSPFNEIFLPFVSK